MYFVVFCKNLTNLTKIRCTYNFLQAYEWNELIKDQKRINKKVLVIFCGFQPTHSKLCISGMTVITRMILYYIGWKVICLIEIRNFLTLRFYKQESQAVTSIIF